MSILKNGATLIYEELIPTGESVVLAVDRDFVTWLKDDKGNCYCGHYFQKHLIGLEEAVTDFRARARKPVKV